MDEIIEATISDAEIAEFKRHLNAASESGQDALTQAKFDYAYALLRSSHKEDVQKGIDMLEGLFEEGDHSAKRDYLYFVAIGHTRLRHYQQALDCVKTFLSHEPANNQARQLQSEIEKRLKKNALAGMALAGGAVLALGGLISLGMSLSKK